MKREDSEQAKEGRHEGLRRRDRTRVRSGDRNRLRKGEKACWGGEIGAGLRREENRLGREERSKEDRREQAEETRKEGVCRE